MGLAGNNADLNTEIGRTAPCRWRVGINNAAKQGRRFSSGLRGQGAAGAAVDYAAKGPPTQNMNNADTWPPTLLFHGPCIR